MMRNQDLTQRLAQNIKRNRAEVTPQTIKDYFFELETALRDVPPENIVNYDETNFTDYPGKAKVVCKRGSKRCDNVLDNSKTSISVMLSAGADGTLLPPFIVYKAKHRYVEWEENGPVGSKFDVSNSGWFDVRTFSAWFKQILLPYFRQKEGNKVMIGDNLSSHVTIEDIELCEANNIRFILLPPNSTHLCQPLDVSYFGPLKKCWRNILREWKMKKRGPFQKSDFPMLLQKTFESIEAASKKNILSGFRGTGITPLNQDEVLKRLPRSNSVTDDANVQAGVSNSLINFLEATRRPEKRGPSRRRRLNVASGKPVTLEDLNQEEREEQHEASSDSEEVADENPVINDNHKNESSNKNETAEDDTELPCENTTNFKFYIARVQQIDEAEGTFSVCFMRRKRAFLSEEVYFFFPSAKDQSLITDLDIVKVLNKCIPLRRDRYTFQDLPNVTLE